METKRIYDRKSYMGCLETVFNFYKTCRNTIEDYLKNNGEIEISDEEKSEWRFDLLGYDGTMSVENLTIDGGGNFVMQCVNELDGLTYFIQWYEINNDIVIIQMIMDKVLSCTEPDMEAIKENIYSRLIDSNWNGIEYTSGILSGIVGKECECYDQCIDEPIEDDYLMKACFKFDGCDLTVRVYYTRDGEQITDIDVKQE